MLTHPGLDYEGKRLKTAIENYFLCVETKHVHARNIEKIRSFIRTMPGVSLEQALTYKSAQIGHVLKDPIFSRLVEPLTFIGNRLIPSRIRAGGVVARPALVVQSFNKEDTELKNSKKVMMKTKNKKNKKRKKKMKTKNKVSRVALCCHMQFFGSELIFCHVTH